MNEILDCTCCEDTCCPDSEASKRRKNPPNSRRQVPLTVRPPTHSKQQSSGVPAHKHFEGEREVLSDEEGRLPYSNSDQLSAEFRSPIPKLIPRLIGEDLPDEGDLWWTDEMIYPEGDTGDPVGDDKSVSETNSRRGRERGEGGERVRTHSRRAFRDRNLRSDLSPNNEFTEGDNLVSRAVPLSSSHAPTPLGGPTEEETSRGGRAERTAGDAGGIHAVSVSQKESDSQRYSSRSSLYRAPSFPSTPSIESAPEKDGEGEGNHNSPTDEPLTHRAPPADLSGLVSCFNFHTTTQTRSIGAETNFLDCLPTIPGRHKQNEETQPTDPPSQRPLPHYGYGEVRLESPPRPSYIHPDPLPVHIGGVRLSTLSSASSPFHTNSRTSSAFLQDPQVTLTGHRVRRAARHMPPSLIPRNGGDTADDAIAPPSIDISSAHPHMTTPPCAGVSSSPHPFTTEFTTTKQGQVQTDNRNPPPADEGVPVFLSACLTPRGAPEVSAEFDALSLADVLSFSQNHLRPVRASARRTTRGPSWGASRANIRA
uniref:Uncharacterized protein n=1 Tax=Chromera velia CCMP2878 TaxID=1169474 RepID=A0A0G4HF38_9ALVE|eukprot:Cvel_6613.t1-p1 / transcript=Cvel_6613.t1 / gene=Cvel_6613 / organism=Chromera_velia_CCMP2878 / gene_product=hypothetical protein / transcript_product=hypothetical protein / location=Cvel_scaffold327:58140-60167(+) / protein_length=537 / sequence_SO=supercontig / SO=protein_coding / is_pseudo=false